MCAVQILDKISQDEIEWKRQFDEFMIETDRISMIEAATEEGLQKGLEQIEKAKRLEEKTIPEDIDYLSITGLRLEARQKLNKHKPHSIGQASRISGVSPADINVLMVELERARRSK